MTMSLRIDKNLGGRKVEILTCLRVLAAEFLPEISQRFGERQFKKRAAASNRSLSQERDTLVAVLRQTAGRENWPPQTAGWHALADGSRRK
jgi:hypothetical protein